MGIEHHLCKISLIINLNKIFKKKKKKYDYSFDHPDGFINDWILAVIYIFTIVTSKI